MNTNSNATHKQRYQAPQCEMFNVVFKESVFFTPSKSASFTMEYESFDYNEEATEEK